MSRPIDAIGECTDCHQLVFYEYDIPPWYIPTFNKVSLPSELWLPLLLMQPIRIYRPIYNGIPRYEPDHGEHRRDFAYSNDIVQTLRLLVQEWVDAKGG